MRVPIIFMLAVSIANVFASQGAPKRNQPNKKAIIIGDSHACGSFGAELVSRMAKHGYDAELYCAVSSAPIHWLNGTVPKGQSCQFQAIGAKLGKCPTAMPKLSDLLSKPIDLVVVELGTNSLLDKVPDANYSKMIKQISAAKIKCAWISAPFIFWQKAKGFAPARLKEEGDNLKSFNDGLAKDMQGSTCELIDSTHATAVGPGSAVVDGVHRTSSAGRAWAAAVAP